MAYRDKEKQLAAQRRWYRKNKAMEIVRRDATRKRLAEECREIVAAIKEKAVCADCGGKFPNCCYDFHHREPTEKVEEVSTMVGRGSRAAVLREIEKCVILCANCHRIRHHG